MYRPLYQAVCGERGAAGRGEETCRWKARRDSEQNVPAMLGWPQVQAGNWHCTRDAQAGHLWENNPWIGTCKIQKRSAVLLWNLNFCVGKIRDESWGKSWCSFCEWEWVGAGGSLQHIHGRQSCSRLWLISYKETTGLKKLLSCKLLRENSQQAWMHAVCFRYYLSATSRDDTGLSRL